MKFKIITLISILAITSVHVAKPEQKCPDLCARSAGDGSTEVVTLLSVADLTTQGLITPNLFHITAPSLAAFYFPKPKGRPFLTVADLKRETTVAYKASATNYLFPSTLLIAALAKLDDQQEALVNDYIAEYAKDMHSFQTNNLKLLVINMIYTEADRDLILNNLIWLQVEGRIQRYSTSSTFSVIAFTDQQKATRPENLVTYDWRTKTFGQPGMIPVTQSAQ